MIKQYLKLLFVMVCWFTHQANSQIFSYAVHMGSQNDDYGRGMAVDASGNVYTTGTYKGTGDFDPGPSIYNLSVTGIFEDIFICKLDSAGNLVWAKSVGGVNSDYPAAITVDDAGNVYVTGQFQVTVDFDPGPGTYNLTATGITEIFVLKLNSSGNFVWAKQFTGGFLESGHSISVDQNGNVYTTGVFQQTIDFDPGPGVYNVTCATGSDAFISILDSSGNFAWAGQLGSEIGRDIVVDDSGNIFITGYFDGTQDFDPGSGVFNMTSSGSLDIYISKLDATGNFIWAKKMGGSGSDWGISLFIDADGNILSTGFFTNTADFDPGSGTFNMTAPGTNMEQVYISKWDASGNFVWAKQFGSPTNEYGYSVAADNNGNVYGTGYFTGTADFDPGPGTHNMTAAQSDIYVVKLDSSGNYSWAFQAGATGYDLGISIDVDGAGNIYTSGYFVSTADFDPGPGVFNLSTFGSDDIFVLKVSDTPVGLNEATSSIQGIVYPNPSEDEINIRFDETIYSGEIEIISTDGKKIFNQKIHNTNEENLRVENLLPGMYFMKVTCNERIFTQKVIIK